jgi:DNA primase
MNAAEIAARLGGATRDGKGWQCRCPSHADKSPSLSIIEKGGKILFTCRAGCDQDAVLDALRKQKLWPEAEERVQSQIVGTYNYRDAEGALRYQVVRLQPKKFFQRRPNGAAGNFINNMTGIQPLPYRLPEILDLSDSVVFVPEGEKDVDALVGAGLVATCNHGGAGKWRSEISRWLAGRDVVILPDNDDTGRSHAQDVARKLTGIAARVRILELPGLPAKGDVSDWIATGGNADELERLAALALDWKPKATAARRKAQALDNAPWLANAQYDKLGELLPNLANMTLAIRTNLATSNTVAHDEMLRAAILCDAIPDTNRGD